MNETNEKKKYWERNQVNRGGSLFGMVEKRRKNRYTQQKQQNKKESFLWKL